MAPVGQGLMKMEAIPHTAHSGSGPAHGAINKRNKKETTFYLSRKAALHIENPKTSVRRGCDCSLASCTKPYLRQVSASQLGLVRARALGEPLLVQFRIAAQAGFFQVTWAKQI